jgi:hypothetical protein
MLKRQIKELESEIVTDKVRGSGPDHPYTERAFIIRGLAYECRAKVERLRKRLQRRVDDLIDLVVEINEYIETLDDSLIRQIITLRHMNGLTWEQVAASIGGGNSGDSCRKMHDRFLR